MRDNDWLNDVMDLDHPVRVNEDGTVTGRGIQVYAPESVIMTGHDGQILQAHEDAWITELRRQRWEPETGWTGQDRYHGAIMHPSEYIGGGLADHILETPGVWVAIVVTCLRGDPDNAGEDFNPDAHSYEDCADDSENEDEVAGWAVLHMDDGPDTESYALTTVPRLIPDPSDIAGQPRMTLAAARQAVINWRIAGHFATIRIVRVTDLAVMPAEAPEPGQEG